MATAAGKAQARVFDAIRRFEQPNFARKVTQGLARPLRNVFMIYKLSLDFALIGVILNAVQVSG